MGRQAGHHFIPASYLSGFTVEATKEASFWSVPVKSGQAFSTSPVKSCKKRDYYSIEHKDSLLVEKWYAQEIEPKIKSSIDHIARNSTLPSKDEMQNLLLLAATLYLRTPSNRALLEAPLTRAKEIVDSIADGVKISNASDFNYTQTDIIKSEIRLISTVMASLCKKYYRLYVASDEDVNFLTSDNPFLLNHPNGGSGFYYGLETPSTELSIPVSRKAVLVGRNEPFQEGVFNANKVFAGLINTKIILNTDRFFYAPYPDVWLVDDELKPHIHNIFGKRPAR
ncbi:DUF4238 domain-containing protein [Enterovibrio makurazakiensis]|uniref:DUF4238 domain-containing protein n=1 Tax=Enterovibrio makurazakiensis TaxID=2910232 RepID=UPI003D24DBC1